MSNRDRYLTGEGGGVEIEGCVAQYMKTTYIKKPSALVKDGYAVLEKKYSR